MRNMVSLVTSGDAIATGPLRAARPVSGRCTSPVQITEVGGHHNRPMLDTFVRCRKCPECLRHKRAVWSARAAHEIGAHPRTWMVTLTCSAPAHFRLVEQARSNARKRGFTPEHWGPSEEFAERWRQLGIEVTKWLKRLRSSGGAFTYLLVVEAHKSGLPHVHLLIHERSNVTYRLLTTSWKLGFSHAKLVEGTSAARYVTKYLVKSVLARVRASQHYGQTADVVESTPCVYNPVSLCEEKKPPNVHPNENKKPRF